MSNIVCIEKLYRIYGAGIHKIRFNLKQEHNIEIPYLIIETILLKSKYNLTRFKNYFDRNKLDNSIDGFINLKPLIF